MLITFPDLVCIWIVQKSSDVFCYFSVLALLAQLCCLIYNSACTVLFIIFNFGSNSSWRGERRCVETSTAAWRPRRPQTAAFKGGDAAHGGCEPCMVYCMISFFSSVQKGRLLPPLWSCDFKWVHTVLLRETCHSTNEYAIPIQFPFCLCVAITNLFIKSFHTWRLSTSISGLFQAFCRIL